MSNIHALPRSPLSTICSIRLDLPIPGPPHINSGLFSLKARKTCFFNCTVFTVLRSSIIVAGIFNSYFFYLHYYSMTSCLNGQPLYASFFNFSFKYFVIASCQPCPGCRLSTARPRSYSMFSRHIILLCTCIN